MGAFCKGVGRLTDTRARMLSQDATGTVGRGRAGNSHAADPTEATP